MVYSHRWQNVEFYDVSTTNPCFTCTRTKDYIHSYAVGNDPVEVMGTMLWDSGISRDQLGQNITRLQQHNRVPELPAENILNTQSNSLYQLSIERESEITGNLAFLSAVSDNALRVVAVCIEEDDTADGIAIRIAANTGDMSEIIGGLRGIGKCLERAATRGTWATAVICLTDDSHRDVQG